MKCFFALFAAAWCLCSLGDVVSAADVYLSVSQTAFFQLGDDGSPSEIVVCPKGLVVVGQESRAVEGRRFRYSCEVEGSRRGWIPEADLRQFSDVVESTTGRLAPDEVADRASVPTPIRRYGQGSLVEPFVRITRLIEQNERLPEANRVPEPYFARASLYFAAKDLPEATKDYLRAMTYASKSTQTLDSYRRYLPGFRVALEEFVEIPAAPAGAWENDAATGALHFNGALDHFRRSRFERAARGFGDAISVQPHNPIYWYYRSVSHRRMGNPDKAVFDALFGAFVERKRESSSWNRMTTRALTHIQGADRFWLERFRHGDPSYSVVDER